MKRVLKILSIIFFLAATIVACKEFISEPSSQGEEYSVKSRALNFEATDYYWSNNTKIPVRKVERQFYVEFYSKDENRIKEECTKKGIKLYTVHAIRDRASFTAEGTEGSGAKIFTNLMAGFMEGSYEQCIEVLSSTLYWSPFYKNEDTRYGSFKVTSSFYVVLRPGTTLQQIEELAKKNAVEMIGVYKHNSNWYILACTNQSKGNSFEMANLFYESGLFEQSFANTISGRLSSNCIDEPEFANGTLWHLGNNPWNDSIHVNYCDAMSLFNQIPNAKENLSSIRIGIIDTGVQTDHPDLPNVLDGWDAHTGHTNIVCAPHGTQVAGFIGAEPNNGVGTAGIAYGAKILPVSFLVDGDSIISAAEVMAEAIMYAATEGAKVINCSWNWDPNNYGNLITNAIYTALNNQHINDVVIVFASGNNESASVSYAPTDVNFPAKAFPEILVVGAIDIHGERAPFSNYGPELDVVAPGAGVYSTSSGSSYTYTYAPIHGTSFAAPQVSALAALLFAVNPDLKAEDVRNAIESNTKKLPSYIYNNVPGRHGTWESETGYGLIDLYEAIKSVMSPIISGANQLCYGSAQYTLLGPTSGPIYWTSSDTTRLKVNSSGNPVTATRVGANTGTVTLSAHGSIGGAAIATITITICAPPVPGSISPGYQTIYSEESIYLIHTGSSNVTTRLWWKSTDNGSSWSPTSATGTDYSEVLNDEGSYRYKVQVNGLNLYSSESVITVEPPPPPEIIGDDQLCSGSAQYYLDNAPSGTIYWTSSDTNLLSVDSSGNPVTATREGTGTGTVTLSAHLGNTGFGSELASISITICPLPLPPPVISGSGTICSSTSFSASDWQSGYYWDSNGLVSISSSSSSSTYISPASSSSSGSATIYVKDSNGTVLDSYGVWVGKPTALSGVYSESGNGCTAGSSTHWMAHGNADCANVVWGVFGYNDSYEQVFADIESTWSECSYGYEYASIYFDEPGNYTVYVYTENSCGHTNPVSQSNFYVYKFRMGFNPKTNEIEIHVDDGQAGRSFASNTQFTVTISDNSGTARSQSNYSGNSFKVPVSSLSDGTYTVKISNGTISDTQQLVIKR